MIALRRARSWARQTLLDVALLVLAPGALALRAADGFWVNGGSVWRPTLLCGLAAAGYGFFRGSYFHPVNHLRYGRWLGESPWQPGEPLPLGPVGLRWQDAVMVVAVAAAAPAAWPTRLAAALAGFAAGYCVAVWRAALEQREYGFAYGLPALAPVLLPLGVVLPAELWWGVAAGLGCVSLTASQASLARSEPGWTRIDRNTTARHFSGNGEVDAARAPQEAAGQPVTALLGEEREFRWPLGHAAAAGLMAAWWLFCLGEWLDRVAPADVLTAEDHRTFQLAVVPLAAGPLIPVIVLRLFSVGAWYRPPVGLWSRLRLGRPILPRYDIVLMPLLAGLLTASVLPRMLMLVGAAVSVAIAAGGGVGMALLLGLPPSHQAWRHTGGHSMVLRPSIR